MAETKVMLAALGRCPLFIQLVFGAAAVAVIVVMIYGTLWMLAAVVNGARRLRDALSTDCTDERESFDGVWMDTEAYAEITGAEPRRLPAKAPDISVDAIIAEMRGPKHVGRV